jgi:hypothetical protein
LQRVDTRAPSAQMLKDNVAELFSHGPFGTPALTDSQSILGCASS